MPILAKEDDARLLWYANHAHGSGLAYNVVTITAIVDGAAWERLARRRSGGSQGWIRELDRLRHDVTGKILLPVDWSPMQDDRLGDRAHRRCDPPPTLFMEDTGWPYSPLDDYIRCGTRSTTGCSPSPAVGMRILDIQACFQVAHGSYRRREAVLWQKIDDANNYAALVRLLFRNCARAPGPRQLYVRGAEYRDQWESRLLRTSTGHRCTDCGGYVRFRISAASLTISATMSAAGRTWRMSPTPSPTSIAAASKSSAATAF